MCQSARLALNSTNAGSGRASQRAAARTGANVPPRTTAPATARRKPSGSGRQKAIQGAASTTSGAVTSISSRCWVMCTQSSLSAQVSIGESSARSVEARAPYNASPRQSGVRGRRPVRTSRSLACRVPTQYHAPRKTTSASAAGSFTAQPPSSAWRSSESSSFSAPRNRIAQMARMTISRLSGTTRVSTAPAVTSLISSSSPSRHEVEQDEGDELDQAESAPVDGDRLGRGAQQLEGASAPVQGLGEQRPEPVEDADHVGRKQSRPTDEDCGEAAVAGPEAEVHVLDGLNHDRRDGQPDRRQHADSPEAGIGLARRPGREQRARDAPEHADQDHAAV